MVRAFFMPASKGHPDIMPEWIPILGGLAALITAVGGLIAIRRKNKTDMIDQIQEERNRLDAKLAESETRRTADTTALNTRVDSLSASLNAAIAANNVKDLWVLIQANHITMLNARIELVDPPAPPLPVLPQLPVPAPATPHL